MAELEEGVRVAHQQEVKVYAAINISAWNSDLEQVSAKTGELAEIGVDGVILSDPGVLALVRRVAPTMPVHLSTQANTTNTEAVRFWHAARGQPHCVGAGAEPGGDRRDRVGRSRG